jgi:integrase
MVTAEIRKRDNLPVVTRRFKDVAKLAIQRLEQEIALGRGKASYKGYVQIIDDYLIPILGRHAITKIDDLALEALDEKRTEMMGYEPSTSTKLTHNVALNRVFDEAVIRGFLTEANRPKLQVKGKKNDRRAAFDLKEVHVLRAGFEGWIAAAKTDESREHRELLRDYVDVLLDTGARPGIELLNLQWKQIKTSAKPAVVDTGEMTDGRDEEPEPILKTELNLSAEMSVKGKTGRRDILGMQLTVAALVRIAKRNYGERPSLIDPLSDLTQAKSKDYVFRTKAKTQPANLGKMFIAYLKEKDLLVDPVTGQSRVLYSLRHTYATLKLTYHKVPVHTLARQMGTSVLMIEKHYSHLKVMEAIEQLRGEETRRLLTRASDLLD